MRDKNAEGIYSSPARTAIISGAIIIKHTVNGNDTVYNNSNETFNRETTPVTENDIPDVIKRFHNREKEIERERTEKSFFVPKQEIVDNGYDLSINKYKKVEYVPVEYPPTEEILAEIRRIEKQIAVEMDELEKLLGK